MAKETEAAAQKPNAGGAAKPKSGGGAKPDIATLAGLLLAAAGIIGGLILEGGSIRDITQVTAAMIVLGGTVGAVLVSTPLHVAIGAAKGLVDVFLDRAAPPDRLVEDIIGYATKARKTGVVSLETDADAIADPFLRKALMLAIDGTDLQEIRRMMELDIELGEHHTEAEAKVFEAAGGYAPTIGIIGAVLGLIQVMKHLENIEEVGHGIAVAFVATVYGVGVANLFFLPAAAKIKARMHVESRRKELILEGVSGIVEGLNPKLIRSKLEAFAPPAPAKKAKPGKAAATQPAQA
jgi:chemotaxis protein MotA